MLSCDNNNNNNNDDDDDESVFILHEFNKLLIDVCVLLSITAVLSHTVSQLFHQLLLVNAVL